MKNLYKFWGIIAIVAVIGFTLAGCGDKDDPASDITFSGVTADGSAAQTTTQLTLIFSQAISGLTADDIILTGVSVSKGTLSGSGPIYTLPISGFSSGGALTVIVAKTGYTINGSPQTVTIYYYTSSSGGGETTPDAPTDVTATAQSSSSISVSWSAVSGATSYKVYYEIGNSTTKNLAGTVTGTSYTHTGLTASTTYYYYITAVNSAGESGYSSYKSATTQSSSGGGTTIPSTPTGVTATATSSTSIKISWNAVSGATSYKIYAPNDPGTNSGFILLDTVTTTSYTDTYPIAGETWYYRVSAVNSAGESAQSASVSAKTPSSSSGGGTTKPSAPTGVTASRNPRSSEYVTVSWNTVSGATSYKIYVSTTATGTYQFAGTRSSSPGEMFIDNNNTSYWKVSAVNDAGESALSSTYGTALGRQ